MTVTAWTEYIAEPESVVLDSTGVTIDPAGVRLVEWMAVGTRLYKVDGDSYQVYSLESRDNA